jgi:hypothetical protein
MFDHAVEEWFLKPENEALVLAGESPAELEQALEEWCPIQVEKWLSRETRRIGWNVRACGVDKKYKRCCGGATVK